MYLCISWVCVCVGECVCVWVWVCVCVRQSVCVCMLAQVHVLPILSHLCAT